MDANEAVARVAHALSEVIAIYPITPASSMGELADAWSTEGRPNTFGVVPTVVEMQSEAGAAGTLHGAALKGALATTFTSSQGLLLMIPNMFKMAGELLPTVIHVAARSIATHALSIFGDHSDVMATRGTGFALLSSSSVQEAQDLALVAHAAALESRIPFLHFFDGFRTSHQIDKVRTLSDEDILAVVDEQAILDHRARGLSPDHPVIRGSSQNPDVFFQSREAANPYYDALPATVQRVMDRLADRVGRHYRLVEYVGDPDAERVLVLMGSAAGAARETVEALKQHGERVGVLVVHLYRPFPTAAFLDAVPVSARAVAVLDRTKEPGSLGEPLFLDVVAALHEAEDREPPRVVGVRYGLASKEVTPAMLKGLFDELGGPGTRRRLTLGIVDDLTGTSVQPDESFVTEGGSLRAVFYGLGSDGTVSATKQAVKIVGEQTELFAQGYFVYDSKKAGTVTVSHLRVGPEPIDSTYLVQQADFVSCSQSSFLERMDVLRLARPGATVLLNVPYPVEEAWAHLPVEVREAVVDKALHLWVVDAFALASELGLGRRINTIMQTAFFVLTGVLGDKDVTEHVKAAVEKAYGTRGEEVVERNRAAVDAAARALNRVAVPVEAGVGPRRRRLVPDAAPEFVRRVTGPLLAGHGDLLPVSALPADGTFPTGTSKWEKRSIARELPVWDPGICTDCAKCVAVCPHAAIRMKVFAPGDAPYGVLAKPFRSKDLPGRLLAIQVAPDDCTGCGVCVEVCPAVDKADPGHKSLDMAPAEAHRDVERRRYELFRTVPDLPRGLLPVDSLKGSQVLPPLFEFSGACAGCGETPYLTLLSRLFGDRLLVANATGCSSIYGGNLPTTPWTCGDDGRGPAWANSLFEDNAEFGLGLRLAADQQTTVARELVRRLASVIGADVAEPLLGDDTDVGRRRELVAELRVRLHDVDGDDARRLESLADELVPRTLWIVGGDGWAYDIGFGGLDHVLASGHDVNVLVLDSEVYSNTGGQASKATPRGAVARFAAAGKSTAKKDLGRMAMAYGNVYVAQVALGGSEIQTVKALLEAEAWKGPSLVIAYAGCVPAHGYPESQTMAHERAAVRSGYWPLYRYRPDSGLQVDSRPPTMAVRDFALSEDRFSTLVRTHPERAEALLSATEHDAEERLHLYEILDASRDPQS